MVAGLANGTTNRFAVDPEAIPGVIVELNTTPTKPLPAPAAMLGKSLTRKTATVPLALGTTAISWKPGERLGTLPVVMPNGLPPESVEVPRFGSYVTNPYPPKRPLVSRVPKITFSWFAPARAPFRLV